MADNALLALETFHCSKKIKRKQDIMLGLEVDRIGASIGSAGLIWIKISAELN